MISKCFYNEKKNMKNESDDGDNGDVIWVIQQNRAEGVADLSIVCILSTQSVGQHKFLVFSRLKFLHVSGKLFILSFNNSVS